MFSDPAQNVAAFGLTEGMRVADFGTGSGAYALPMAERVGSTGRVYAIDIQNELLSRLDKLAREHRRGNIEIIWGNVEKQGGSKIGNQIIDLVLIANTLFQSDAKYTLALEAKRILVPKGRVVIIDWQDSYGGLGPPAELVVKPEQAKKIFEQAGFKHQTDFPPGTHHYGMILNKE